MTGESSQSPQPEGKGPPNREAFPASISGENQAERAGSERGLRRKKRVEKERTGFARFWKDWLEPFVFALLITQFLVTMVLVDGVSMMPNLRNGERVIVPKYETWLHRLGIGEFERGDVVVFKPPRAAAEVAPRLRRSFAGLWEYRPHLIKRIIGVPGDTVRIEGGEVFVNGQKLDSSFTTAYWRKQGCWDTGSPLANQAASSMEQILPDALEVTVPEGHYFVMGDNRTVGGSEDSRLFGTVALADIAGRASAVAWPIVQPEQLNYDCQTATTTPAGEGQRLAWRLLEDPPAFNELKPPQP